jgi:hypothetical protein
MWGLIDVSRNVKKQIDVSRGDTYWFDLEKPSADLVTIKLGDVSLRAEQQHIRALLLQYIEDVRPTSVGIWRLLDEASRQDVKDLSIQPLLGTDPVFVADLFESRRIELSGASSKLASERLAAREILSGDSSLGCDERHYSNADGVLLVRLVISCR